MINRSPVAKSIAILSAFVLLTGRVSRSVPPQHNPVPKPSIQEGLPEDLIESMERRRAAILSSTAGWSGPEIQSVILVPRLWNPGDTITVAFKGGSNDLRAKIAGAARLWERVANVHFDFGPSPASGSYREWSESDSDYRAQVRVSFDSGEQGGYWSAVGQESIDRSLRRPNKASMSLEGLDHELPADWQSIAVHEFGHVLGFEHEHQGPLSTCAQEYRWDDEDAYIPTTDPNSGAFITDAQGRHPGIYRVMGGPPNYWANVRIDFNLKKFPYSTDLYSSPFDKASIMKYHFADWMYKDLAASATSGCYSSKNTDLSEEDKKTASARYPFQPNDAKRLLDARLALVQKLLGQKNISPEVQDIFKATKKSVQKSRSQY